LVKGVERLEDLCKDKAPTMKHTQLVAKFYGPKKQRTLCSEHSNFDKMNPKMLMRNQTHTSEGAFESTFQKYYKLKIVCGRLK